ncbi:adenosylcobinamide-GDP ribazoletransferase [Mariniluteicoccus endophyticus]
MGAVSDGVRMAVGTLTVIPSGRFETTPAAARWAMTLAPLAVLPLGALAAGVVWLGRTAGAPTLLIGVAVVAGLVWATRAMHADGFADVVDGLGGGWTPDRAREIMHRGDVGPMGALALALGAIAQAACWARLAELPLGWLVALALVPVSRSALTIPCLRGIAPMPGSSLGRVVASSVPRPVAIAWWVVGLAVLGLVAGAAGLRLWQGVLAAAVAYAAVGLLVARCARAFGGTNGDVMGASIEVSLTAALVVLACAR